MPPTLAERPPPPDDEPRKEPCLVCGNIVIIYPDLGVMHHDDPYSDLDHLAKVKNENY